MSQFGDSVANVHAASLDNQSLGGLARIFRERTPDDYS
jgi:hypothetical protein